MGKGMHCRNFALLLAAMLAGAVLEGSGAAQGGDGRITLHVFGPGRPFMFPVTGGQTEFAWAELAATREHSHLTRPLPAC